MGYRAPDLIAPLLGWRAWYVRPTEEGWRLFSIHYGEAWAPGEQLEAVCFRNRYVSTANENTHARHTPPGKDCLCGVYAAKEAEHARQYFIASYSGAEAVRQGEDYVHRAVGQVSLWGRVVEGTHGYRAATAYPARLWLPTDRPDGRPFDVEAAALDLLDYGVAVDLIEAGTRVEIMRELRAIERSLP
jgi:hypothetical protein